jgi:hypothetical protein
MASLISRGGFALTEEAAGSALLASDGFLMGSSLF